MGWTTSLQIFTGMLRQRLMLHTRFFAPTTAAPALPQLAGLPVPPPTGMEDESSQPSWIWFAVPKRKHTRSRKRMKTTAQKRLGLKKNIVFDPRTGEVTLKHKLPFNWKEYLPKLD